MKPLRLLVASSLVLAVGSLTAAPVPLPRAHAHNDYEHTRPLLDALDHGFCSVEADVWLVDGELLVAHHRSEVQPGRTLQKLYLQPLLDRTKQNGGKVHPDGPAFTLLIDFKSEAEATYAALQKELEPFHPMLTRFENDQTIDGAVSLILSGNRPRATVQAQPTRWVGIDGRLVDLKEENSKHLLPLISDNWGSHFTWRGQGPMTAREAAKLKEIIDQVHVRGQRIRFWGSPDRVEVWKALDAAGVDLLNTDDLAGMRSYLSPRPK